MEKTIRSEAYTVFCRILRDTREFMEIKQAELARRLGRPQSFIAKVEIGEQRVDVVEFPAIAHAMKVSPEKLLARLSKEIEATKKARR